ncbi:hypothetical protein Tco_0296253 [Tanacetum coccineum]
MVINSPCLTHKKELAIPGQTTTGKEFSNPLMVGSLPKTISAKVRIYQKSHENSQKKGQARTRESEEYKKKLEEYKAEARKVKPQSKSAKKNQRLKDWKARQEGLEASPNTYK